MELSDLYNSSNFSLYKNTCRTCLQFHQGNENEDKIFIINHNIKDKIGSFVAIDFTEEKCLSNFICGICFEKLNNAFEFKKQVERANEILKQYLKTAFTKEGTVWSVLEQVNRSLINDLTQDGEEDCKNSSQEFKELEIFDNDTLTAAISAEDENIEDLLKDKKHIQKRKKLVCSLCTKNFKTKNLLKAHLKIHKIVYKLECNDCGKKYSNQYDLKVHLRKHSGVRPFCCKVCQKTFADPRCFEKHKKIHSGEKLFKCELCDKSFIHSYTLKTHLRTHSGEKPFICAKCGHSFSTATQLKLHTRIHHTREKPYSCNLCSKKFVSSSGLSNHKMTHTGERKFICSICGKGSRTTSDLKCHLRTHTGERPFKCTFPDCDKKYKTNSQLCTHIRTHTGEKRYKCQTCLKSFFDTAGVKSHVCSY